MSAAIGFGFSVPKEPGAYVEVDGSRAGVIGRRKSKVLVLGHRLSTGTIAKDVLSFVPSIAAGKTYFGRGSFLARTIELVKLAYPGAEVWAIAQDDDAGGAKAKWTLTVTASSSETGTLFIYIAGQLVTVGVTAGDSATTIATAIAAAVNAALDLPVTATSDAGVASIECRHKALRGNDIDVRLNYRGPSNGEVLPGGVTVAIAQTVQGTTEPALTNSIAGMVENEYDTIVNPYATSTSLDALATEMASRWGALEMLYGHVVGAHSASYADLITFSGSSTQNDPHATILGYYNSPTPTWEVAAGLGALTAQLQMDSDLATLAQGFTGLPIYGMLPPTPGSEFSITERDVLLSYGIATFTTDGSDCYLSRARTTYLNDSSGTADMAYYDQRTLAIVQRMIRADKAAWLSRFAGSVLVDDATKVAAGQKVCSIAIARGWFSDRYTMYEAAGLVKDRRTFLDNLIIQVNDEDPNRLDILYPPNISGWLAVTAMKFQFRLN